MIQDTPRLLQALLESEVSFVVVGGFAANLHGSSHLTKDLDVVVPINLESCRRILNAFQKHHPKFYQTIGRPPVLRTAEELSEFKNLYWDTEIGRIDMLGSMPPVGDFERVKSASRVADLGPLSVQLVSLDDLITVKEFVARPKDIAVAIELKAIRERLAAK
jgi:hypothetical protein